MENFNVNVKFGITSEKEILPIITKYFGRTITWSGSKNKFAKHDFYDAEGNSYELRTRKISSTFYDTTIVACDKYQFFKSSGSLFFLFRFTDGLFYIKYTPEQFKDYFVDEKYRRGTPRLLDGKVKYDKPRPHVFIPHCDLIKISDVKL